MDVYRANAAVLAERSLSSTYPVLEQLIGPTSFEPVAKYFWLQHPPQRGDLAQWGAELPAFLAAAPQLAAEPFLADVARVEWALHCAATAVNAALDAPSFALLANKDDRVTLTFSAGGALLASIYPVAALVNAHLTGDPPIGVAAQKLASGTPEVALVWRHGFKPRVRAVDVAEAALIAALLGRQLLDAALQAALNKDASSDFNTWLSHGVPSGLITGAARMQSAGQN